MTTTRQPRRAARATPSTPPPSDPLQVCLAAAFRSDSPEAAFLHFRPLAAQVPTDDLAVFNGNALVMKANIDAALAMLAPHVATVLARAPEFDLTVVFELPALALALDHACGHLPSSALSAGEIDAMLTEARPWRALTLAYMDVVANPLLRLVPAERVRAIREGNGPLDSARDCVALAAMFHEFEEALSGRHPFTEVQLARLAELGNALVGAIRPKNAPTARGERPAAAIVRDQLARLIEDRYDSLGVALSLAVGRRKADAMLPALRSFVASAPAKAPDAPPQPAPPQ